MNDFNPKAQQAAAQAKPKGCPIKAAGIDYVDYKNLGLIKQYITRFGKIKARYYTGVSLQNQKKLARAIKRARFMALIPYVK